MGFYDWAFRLGPLTVRWGEPKGGGEGCGCKAPGVLRTERGSERLHRKEGQGLTTRRKGETEFPDGKDSLIVRSVMFPTYLSVTFN